MAASRWTVHAWRHVLLAALFWALATAKPSVPVAYCAKINTASMPANNSDFQSDGLCYQFCLNKYALAVVLHKSCWCSNYVPGKAAQVSVDKCSNACPGYPDDLCGGDGLFGYMALSKQPSGTATTGTSVTSTDSSDSGSEPTVSTVTADGTVKTVTVVPTAGSDASNSAGVGTESKKGLSTGGAVGVAVGVVAVFIAIAAGIIFMFLKRRRQRREEEKEGYDVPSQRGSSSGMTGKTGELSENRFVGGSDGRNMSESWENSTQGKRRSHLMPIDPRMDPFTKGIYHHRPENKSHESVNSLQDNQDYSRRVHEPARVLRATNPDPDDD